MAVAADGEGGVAELKEAEIHRDDRTRTAAIQLHLALHTSGRITVDSAPQFAVLIAHIRIELVRQILS
jgi:hypothetical protein